MLKYWFAITNARTNLDPVCDFMFRHNALSTSGSFCWFVNAGIIGEIAPYCDARGIEYVIGESMLSSSGGLRKGSIIWESGSSKPFPKLVEEREESPSVAYFKLANEKYEKQVETCAYCGSQTVTVVKKGSQRLTFTFVPNDPQRRMICRHCKDSTQLTVGSYGYHRPPSRFITPMDAKNTVILGLEQEFEGYFYGWLELQKAHRGCLHYGYDSSIALEERKPYHSTDPNNGKNELSWDCGSYSWWKYASPLPAVCKVVKQYGGKEGASAGVHIHASFMQMSTEQTKFLARRCFEMLQQTKELQNLMVIVSGRTRERLDRWAFIDKTHPDSRETQENGGVREARYTDHHSCISFNRKGTIEFRCFSASLDHKRVLKRMKFVKEYVTLVKNKVRPSDMIKSFSGGTRLFIKEEQEAQLKIGHITQEQCVL